MRQNEGETVWEFWAEEEYVQRLWAGKSKVLRELKDGDQRAERVRCLVPDHGGDLGRGHSAVTPHLVLLP